MMRVCVCAAYMMAVVVHSLMTVVCCDVFAEGDVDEMEGGKG